MGHKPSVISERHYEHRPVDLLRVWHERIEQWILEQAGITLDASARACARWCESIASAL